MERRLFNVNGTPNKAGSLKYYTNLVIRIGSKQTCLRYFLTNLGGNQVLLGYPWFASAQPKIDWAKGWINYNQLPIVLRSNNADKAVFTTRTKGKAVIQMVQADKRIPHPYQAFADVFSNEELKKYPPK